jgi:hypothetical protein
MKMRIGSDHFLEIATLLPVGNMAVRRCETLLRAKEDCR